jgi:hypothetical protein
MMYSRFALDDNQGSVTNVDVQFGNGGGGILQQTALEGGICPRPSDDTSAEHRTDVMLDSV